MPNYPKSLRSYVKVQQKAEICTTKNKSYVEMKQNLMQPHSFQEVKRKFSRPNTQMEARFQKFGLREAKLTTLVAVQLRASSSPVTVERCFTSGHS